MRAAIRAGAYYFVLVFAAGFALGTVRVLWLVPKVGEAVAVALEVPVMLVISWLAAGFLIRHFGVPPDRRSRLIMGGLALALLLGAEVFVSVLVFGRSLSEHLGHYALLPGASGLAGQMAFALIPMVHRAGRA